MPGGAMANILILEDEILVRNQLIQIAADSNKEVTVYSAESISDAHVLLKNYNFSAFFLDIELTDGSGINFAKEIRLLSAYEFTPIVFITADPLQELRAFREIHCYDFISKPFSVENLKQVFEKILNNYVTKVSDGHESKLCLNYASYSHHIDYKDIQYVEYAGRKIIIHTTRESITYKREPLVKFMKTFPANFVQIHQAFFVNTRFITKVDRNQSTVMLQNQNNVLPIGRSFKSEIGGVFIDGN
jgi:two-component system LytT family response regulator